MTSPVLVTGGTGTLGRLVVPLLRDAGRTVRVLSRISHEPTDDVHYVTGDLVTGEGIDGAVRGVETVLHLAGGTNGKGDEEATRNLMRCAAQADVRHLVSISVIGADRVPVGYFKAKLAVERVVTESGLPWTMLRAAQVHDLILALVRTMAKLPVIPAPGAIRFQPVDSGEVAARLAELTLGEPAGLVPDLAGPEVHGMADLIRGYLRANGKRRPLLPLPLPGKAGRAYRAGENLSRAGASIGTRTWADFLAERTGLAAPS